MSKKKFTAGLESLFEEESTEKQKPTSGTAKPKAPASQAAKRKETGKNFTEDLQSFLQSAFDESLERQQEQDRSTDYEQEIKKRRSKPMSGLDALIRATVEPSRVSLSQKTLRRLTVSFDEEKLNKLKKIARQEKAYLRDIIDDIVADFIQQYEQKKGQL